MISLLNYKKKIISETEDVLMFWQMSCYIFEGDCTLINNIFKKTKLSKKPGRNNCLNVEERYNLWVIHQTVPSHQYDILKNITIIQQTNFSIKHTEQKF